MSDWKLIKTAPQDGTTIVATWLDTWADTGTRSQNVHIEAMYWSEDSWWYSYDGDGPARPPTHWMPLPQSPQVTTAPPEAK